MSLISIIPSLCTCPNACVDSCPYALLTRSEGQLPEEVPGAYDVCIRCGHCMAVCPTGALSNAHLQGQEFTEISRLDRAGDPMAFALRTRRSTRSFLREPVSRTELKSLFDTVRYAPTANNAQSLWWFVTLDPDKTRTLGGLARQWLRNTYWADRPEHLWPKDDDPVLRGAPHLALCCAPEASSWGQSDAAIALTYLELLALSRGLGACWAGAFMRALDEWPPLLEELALPEGQKVFGGLFLGRPRHAFRLIPPRKPSAVHWR